jgi:hypothetical protein
MTERDDRDRTPEPTRREAYRETVVDETGRPASAARDIYEERTSGPAGEQVVRSEHVSVPSMATRRAAGVERAKQVIYFIFGFINVLLVIRFVLLLLGASQASSFVSLIYGLSRPFALPFQRIFAEPAFNGSVIEWASLVGIVVYSLIAYGLVRVIELIYAPARPSGRPDR